MHIACCKSRAETDTEFMTTYTYKCRQERSHTKMNKTGTLKANSKKHWFWFSYSTTTSAAHKRLCNAKIVIAKVSSVKCRRSKCFAWKLVYQKPAICVLATAVSIFVPWQHQDLLSFLVWISGFHRFCGTENYRFLWLIPMVIKLMNQVLFGFNAL